MGNRALVVKDYSLYGVVKKTTPSVWGGGRRNIKLRMVEGFENDF